MNIVRNPSGRLELTLGDGTRHVGVTPVRAFPIAAPDNGISIVNVEGREVGWIDQLDALVEPARSLVAEELALREFVPEIRRLQSVSTFATPSVWQVETDRGDTQFTLEGEEDIRRLTRRTLLIASASGVHFRISDLTALDRASRKLIERFL
ncbi:DUF1854 domain-containing protein [Variovorax sp. VNK109]|uniref:cyanophycin metabolism-associated DUF1854 family protein n=1 Tax=Variovorax sp. VNK109 TaxID=3400919 RepID=UPI003C0C8E26